MPTIFPADFKALPKFKSAPALKQRRIALLKWREGSAQPKPTRTPPFQREFVPWETQGPGTRPANHRSFWNAHTLFSVWITLSHLVPTFFKSSVFFLSPPLLTPIPATFFHIHIYVFQGSWEEIKCSFSYLLLWSEHWGCFIRMGVG